MSKKTEDKEGIISEDFDDVKSGSEEVPGKSPVEKPEASEPEETPEKKDDFKESDMALSKAYDELVDNYKSLNEKFIAAETTIKKTEDDFKESDTTLSEAYTKLEAEHEALKEKHSIFVDELVKANNDIINLHALLSDQTAKTKALKKEFIKSNEELKDSEFKVKLLVKDLESKIKYIVKLKKQLVDSKKREKRLPESGKMIRH